MVTNVDWLIILGTVLAGTLIYVLGQLVQRLALGPILEQRRIIGEIASALLFLSNVTTRQAPAGYTFMQPEEPIDALRRIRSLAARLHATRWSIPVYGVWAALHLVPCRTAVEAAVVGLVGWANSLGEPSVDQHRQRVMRALELPGAEQQRT
jgi:hypothetical protein